MLGFKQGLNQAGLHKRSQGGLIQTPFRLLALTSISAYQRYLSPYKGFVCAHRCLYGGESCSQYGRRLVLEQAWYEVWPALSERFRACKDAKNILSLSRPEPPRRKNKPGLGCITSALDCASGSTCDCGGFEWDCCSFEWDGCGG